MNNILSEVMFEDGIHCINLKDKKIKNIER
jgi:hypothetical protein